MKQSTITIIAAGLFWSSLASASPININTASATEIASSLNGIGAHKAQAIVNYRDQNGPFNRAEDVTLVKGIGHSTYDRNKKDILLK
ncbi:MAG: helix-hairpin-helix domain-containing protein [Gammaproteobacteria bacterium]|nr:helix-hairpin-helix domain-containing protein [Gammaproteobacteria bacterium]MBL7000504.1 helix-hairpin-helix domain-containing protein [Gammaproteobacteria bacterium]